MPSRCRFRRSCSGPRRLRHRRRRGYTLVLFAMLFFCLMALAALVIDLGMARLAQRQMQAAVDSAALEGLRWRDRTDVPDVDQARRHEAAKFADFIFERDDDFDITTDADPRAALLQAARANDGIDGSFIDLLQDYLYQPSTQTDHPHLQPNSGNFTRGDMAAGRYTATGENIFHREMSDYSRDDFEYGLDDTAFLVRLRRSGEASEQGVISAGPRFPYLFGRGSLMSRNLVGTQTEHGPGIALRATAIAQARMAMSIGRRIPDAPATAPGSLPFVIERARWITVANGSQNPLKITGNQVQAWDGQTSAYVRVGFVYDFDAADGLGQAFSLGEAAPVDQGSGMIEPSSIFNNAAQRSTDTTGPRLGYVVIVGPVNSSPTNYVVAFGAMEIASATATDLNYSILRSFVGAFNTSSVLSRALDPAVFADQADDPELKDLLIQQTLSDAPDSPLFSPGLVR